MPMESSIYKPGVGRTSASTMPIIITMCAARPLHGAIRHRRSNLELMSNLAIIVTGARLKCAPIHHRGGACVTYTNGTIDV